MNTWKNIRKLASTHIRFHNSGRPGKFGLFPFITFNNHSYYFKVNNRVLGVCLLGNIKQKVMKITGAQVTKGMTIKVSSIYNDWQEGSDLKLVGCGSIKKSSPVMTVNDIEIETMSGNSTVIKNTFVSLILNTDIGKVKLSSRQKVEII